MPFAPNRQTLKYSTMAESTYLGPSGQAYDNFEIPSIISTGTPFNTENLLEPWDNDPYSKFRTSVSFHGSDTLPSSLPDQEHRNAFRLHHTLSDSKVHFPNLQPQTTHYTSMGLSEYEDLETSHGSSSVPAPAGPTSSTESPRCSNIQAATVPQSATIPNGLTAPFRCTDSRCTLKEEDKVFWGKGAKAAYTRHINTHIKPFKCHHKQCMRNTKGFSRSDQLRKHLETHVEKKRRLRNDLKYTAGGIQRKNLRAMSGRERIQIVVELLMVCIELGFEGGDNEWSREVGDDGEEMDEDEESSV